MLAAPSSVQAIEACALPTRRLRGNCHTSVMFTTSPAVYIVSKSIQIMKCGNFCGYIANFVKHSQVVGRSVASPTNVRDIRTVLFVGCIRQSTELVHRRQNPTSTMRENADVFDPHLAGSIEPKAMTYSCQDQWQQTDGWSDSHSKTQANSFF